MKYRVVYKASVEKDLRRLSKKSQEREKIKTEIESILDANPSRGKKLSGEYKGLHSLHIRYKVIVVYKIFRKNVLVLAVESREKGYKRRYL